MINAIQPTKSDTIITLGDHVGRGPDTKGVIDRLIDLADKCQLISVLGNHDEMMLQAKDGVAELQFWLQHRGLSALQSYGSSEGLDLVPSEHFQFLEKCVPYVETESHFFTHANYVPSKPLSQTRSYYLRWLSLRDSIPTAHVSGKTAIVGHTPHREIFDIGHLICLDTGACCGGWLTALEIASRQCWQFDAEGKSRVPEAQSQFLDDPDPDSERREDNEVD